MHAAVLSSMHERRPTIHVENINVYKLARVCTCTLYIKEKCHKNTRSQTILAYYSTLQTNITRKHQGWHK